MPENSTPTTAPPGSPETTGSGTKLTDRQLVLEILTCLRVNMMRETMTTQCDEQFWRFIGAWQEGKSALNEPPREAAPKSPNDDPSSATRRTGAGDNQ